MRARELKTVPVYLNWDTMINGAVLEPFLGSTYIMGYVVPRVKVAVFGVSHTVGYLIPLPPSSRLLRRLRIFVVHYGSEPTGEEVP